MDVGIESTPHQTMAISFALLCAFYFAEERESRACFHFTANAIIKKIQPSLIKGGGQGRLLFAFELDYSQMVADTVALKQQLLHVGPVVAENNVKDICPHLGRLRTATCTSHIVGVSR